MLTSTTVDSGSAVYTSLPVGLGLTAGMIIQDPNTAHFRILVQNNSSGSTIANNAALIWTTASNATGYLVDASTAAAQVIAGVNDLANSTIAAGSFFWMTYKGPATVLVAASVSSGVQVVTSSTAGQLGAASTSAANQMTNVIVRAASGSGGATAAWIF